MADEDPKDPSAKDDKPEPKPDLGDAGKKALDEERKARREAEKQAKDLAERLQKIEDKDKSETERLTEQVATLTKERDAAIQRGDRLEVAVSKALDEDQARRLTSAAKRLTGATREELEADADDFIPDLNIFRTNGGTTPPPGKPREKLRGGSDPDEEPEETDPRKLAAQIPRS